MESATEPRIEALSVENLTRRFGSRVAVDSLSIRVNEGDVYGFLGPNGAGKTTAIRCMLGLINKDAGSVRIFGEGDPVRARQFAGAMVETPAFHGWMTGRQNLRRAIDFAGQGDATDIARVVELVGLKGREDEKVRTYSLGMRQRLGIARALVGRPKILILDEPTNGLDPRGMKEVRDLLSQLARSEKLTIFISSHLLAEIQLLCTRVGIIDKGRMIAEGDVAALLRARLEEVDVGAGNRAALEAALREIPGVHLQGDADEGRIRVALEGLSCHVLNRRLMEAGIEVDALVPVRRSLEELFLDLTSKEIT